MGHQFHLEHTHGRVFRGLDALEHMAHQKRDSHGSNVRMHIPDSIKAAARPADKAQSIGESDVETVVSVIYVTASNGGGGSVVSYSTDSAPLPQTVPTQRTRETSSSTHTMNAYQASYASAVAAAHGTSTLTATATAYPVDSTTLASVVGSPLAATRVDSTASTTQGAAVVAGTPLQATRESTAQKADGNGMTGAQQAGMAIGILAAFALAAGLLFFCWRRRKSARGKDGSEQLIDEKHGSFFGSNQATPAEMPSTRFSSSTIGSQTNAPRLSLRPVTQFLPGFMGGANHNNNQSETRTQPMSEKTSAWERRPQHANDNPFADAAVLSEKDARPASANANPFDEPHGRPTTSQSNHSASNSWEGSEPPTPKSTKFGTASAVAIASGRSTPPMPAQPNNVHRVQLDFKPSMDDELELRSGQLVRMLHEYDDGWALCIRMDRSQQGVVPRTCLSKLPVKPRQGPPPQGGQGRRSPPNGTLSRSMSTQDRPGSRQRLANGDRAQSPTVDQRTRASSDAQKAIGSGRPVRKPVPGQAM